MADNGVKEGAARTEETAAMPKQYKVGYGKGSKNSIYTCVQRELNSSITLTDGSHITK